jgi:four helix bundle protein
MKSQRPHKSLLVWQESIQLVRMVYEIAKGLPKEDKFGMTQQLQEPVVFIPAIIAEGEARKRNIEFVHFLSIASGSLSELDTFEEIISQVKFIVDKTCKEMESLNNQVEVLLSGLMNKRKSFNIQTF